jgi:methionyl-tRNA synthetase
MKMPKNKFYVTTPIYYVNAEPHIGSAYTTVAADVLARYYRTQYGKDNVFFMTGTDEHGAKIQEIAEAQHKKPKQFTDEIVDKFKSTWKLLDISYDGFLRTTDQKHEEAVKKVTQAMYDNGDIYKGSYQALYCVGCEQYKTKSELLEGDVCPDHNRKCEIHEEEAYLFALSKYQEELVKRIENDEIKIRPETRKNEVLSFVKSGLEDVAISRKKEKVSWGIDLPFDETQTTYVWVDAFLNYLTGLGWPESTELSGKFWPADIQLMGKDIIRVHATIWQAMLMSLDLPTSKELFVHGYFTVDGKKMSKSLGNVLKPDELVEKFGSDAVRYAVLREFPFGSDGDISEEKIANRYNYELANGVGNLVQRTLSMIDRYDLSPKKQIMDVCEIGECYEDAKMREAIAENMRDLRFEAILTDIWQNVIRPTNQYLEDKKPWELAKFDMGELAKVMENVYNELFLIADYLDPFMPTAAAKIRNQLATLKPEPIFPRLEN